MTTEPAGRIDGHARTVRELLDNAKFSIDFYQREYAWQERQVQELLGSVVISHKRGQRFIVDGQQRLTNIDAPDRVGVMQQLYDGESPNVEGANESVQNIAARYQNMADHFPEELAGRALPFFVDWLLESVHLVEIEAYSDEDAYTILANVRREDDQKKINALWKQHMQSLKEFGDEEDADFFKNWLRSHHAESIRPGKKGAENKDYERIGSEFHRWVRDQKDRLGLVGSDDFVRFVERDLNFYARQTLVIRAATKQVTPGLESVYYNHDRAFTLQAQALLAALEPTDSPAVVRHKLALVADYLDIWLARRIWNFRTISYSSVRYTIFTLTKELRGKSVAELSALLRTLLDDETETFAKQPRYRLHHQNYRQVRHVLARLTHWLDTECGLASHFEDLVSQGRGRPYEIEHVWADHYDRFTEWFDHPSEFDTARNRIGGLLLLQRGLNQSLGDGTYEQKRDAYVSHGQNLLARSLHPLAYKNNPTFRALIDQTGLPFRAYDSFNPSVQAERQELYLRMAEWVWNPSRVDLDGLRPPVHEPIEDLDEGEDDEPDDTAQASETHEQRQQFWVALIAKARATQRMHGHLSPSRYHWIGVRRDAMWWNFILLRNSTRVELYIDLPDASLNKALFDALHAQRDAVEREFDGPLDWQRLDDKRASRISITLPAGWVEQDNWASTIDAALDRMARLYDALEHRVKAAR